MDDYIIGRIILIILCIANGVLNFAQNKIILGSIWTFMTFIWIYTILERLGVFFV
jgi:hypothetical protein